MQQGKYSSAANSQMAEVGKQQKSCLGSAGSTLVVAHLSFV